MKQYVCGLLFSEDKRFVALVKKNRPLWQAGRLNAIGGKIEEGEAPYQAMRREFQEETGVDRYDWKQFTVLTGKDFVVYFYCAFSDDVLKVKTMEDEEIGIYVTEGVLTNKRLIPNLRVIIPLALDDTGIVKPVMLADNR